MVVWALLVVVMAVFLSHFDWSALEPVEEAFLEEISLMVGLLVIVEAVEGGVSMVFQ